jgi:hypothetical protein
VIPNIALLIASVGGLIGALTSFVGMVVVVKRTSPKERRDAAAGGAAAAEKVLMPPHPYLDLANTVVDLKEKEPERGDDDRPRRRQGRRNR